MLGTAIVNRLDWVPLRLACNSKDVKSGTSRPAAAKLPPKPVTEPTPFHLSTDERAAAHACCVPEPFVFNAQAPDGRLTRARAKQWTGVFTQPAPFQFATDARA